MVSLFTHSHMVAHNAGEGHPERPGAADSRARRAGRRRSGPRPARGDRGSVADLERVHPAGHVARLLAAEPATGFNQLDADTVLAPGSLRAARLAAGAPIDAVRAVAAGRADPRLRRRPPAGPSRRAGQGHGLLPVLQRRRRRARGPVAGSGPGRRGRFRRPSRQRHPGGVRIRRQPVPRLHPPVAVSIRARARRRRPASAISSTPPSFPMRRANTGAPPSPEP
jgi:hypothetical protein